MVNEADLVGDRKAVAQLHRVYQGTVTRWVKDGMTPIEGGGRGRAAVFRLSDTVAFRVAQLEARGAGLGTVNPVLERALKDRAQRQLADQLRVRREGEVILISEARHILSSVVIAARAHLLRLPSSVAVQCAYETDPAKVQALLDGHVRAALSELSRGGSLTETTTPPGPEPKQKGRKP
jgi:phage terminase Nu1 subunit (DNA packaging protein)